MTFLSPLVTIGIPTYNRADGYFRESLQCALNQTYSPLEIVVADNCSSDGTTALVGKTEDPRVRYFRHSRNIGPVNNFNFCLEQARGKYFLLLPDDDLVDLDFVETCVNAARGNGDPGIVRTGIRFIDAQGKSTSQKRNGVGGLSLEEFFLGWFNNQTGLYLCSTLFDTAKFREIGGFNAKFNLFLDCMVELKLVARYGRVDVEDVKASFRGHDAEFTHASAVASWCDDSIVLLDLMCELASRDAQRIRREGMRFFAGLNFRRAMAAKSTLRRLWASWVVYRKFHFQYAPPWRRILSKSIAYGHARALKQKMKQIAAMGRG
jgi:glycosyltransferase involved in cell wall biosynthesis